MVTKIIIAILCGIIVEVAGEREVLVVSGGPDDENIGVLEIYDFLSRTWRAIEKTPSPREFEERYRSTVARRPGTARLVEDDAFMQYDLRNGNAVALAEFPTNLVDGSEVVNYGDTICVVGGYDEATKVARKSVSCWNPLQIGAGNIDENNTSSEARGWLSLPPMHDGRHQPGATVVDGKFFVAGGYEPATHTFLKSVEVFDDVTKKWYRLADLNFPRAELRLLSVSGKLYAIGGRFQHKHSDVVEEYDPLRNQWTPREPMKQPRAKFGAVTRNREIYVVGGIKGFRSDDELKDLEVFSPNKNVWATIQPPMSIIKGPVRATIVKDQF